MNIGVLILFNCFDQEGMDDIEIGPDGLWRGEGGESCDTYKFDGTERRKK